MSTQYRIPRRKSPQIQHARFIGNRRYTQFFSTRPKPAHGEPLINAPYRALRLPDRRPDCLRRSPLPFRWPDGRHKLALVHDCPRVPRSHSTLCNGPHFLGKNGPAFCVEAPPPNPRDLPFLPSRMDAFLTTLSGACRTIDLLVGRIGDCRDATRAPKQVRNGWRLHRRLLVQPATPSKNRRFLSNRWGPAQSECSGFQFKPGASARLSRISLKRSI